jgi:ATP-dependent Clp protease ATP-binding subunit ClpX
LFVPQAENAVHRMSDEKTDQNRRPENLEQQLHELLSKVTIIAPAQPRPDSSGSEEKPSTDDSRETLRKIRQFSLKPRDIRDHLDRFVIRQDEAKKVLSVAICDHYNHVRRCIEDPKFREEEYYKHNIILLGPSGVGKTYLMRCIARLIGVPFVKADATKFSETGYVGHDVEDLVRDLVKAANNDTELAQYGIIYMDEIDKIASQAGTTGKDVSGRGVQINLLKLMEETDVNLFSQTDLIGQMQAIFEMQRGKEPRRRTINTRHILFIVSGAFDKLGEQVKHRVRSSQIGFGSHETDNQRDSDFLRMANTKDFIDYGFEPEFVGRLPIRIVCDPLSADDLEEIMLHSEGSILSQYRFDFQGYGMDFNISREAVKAVAFRAHDEQTGARGLMTVLERVFRNFKFELPSTAIKSFDVDGQTIKSPGETLTVLMKKNESAQRELLKAEIKVFSSEFDKEHGLQLTFTRDAVEAVIDICVAEKRSVRNVFAARFHDFEYGLKLIAKNSGQTSFNITKKIVNNPGEELSRRIAESFKEKK